jgi:hypothetical protein
MFLNFILRKFTPGIKCNVTTQILKTFKNIFANLEKHLVRGKSSPNNFLNFEPIFSRSIKITEII